MGGLPPGGRGVEEGEQVFVDTRAACHGDFAKGLDNWPARAGGRGTLRDARPAQSPSPDNVYDHGLHPLIAAAGGI